jgi:hypothetical protein
MTHGIRRILSSAVVGALCLTTTVTGTSAATAAATPARAGADSPGVGANAPKANPVVVPGDFTGLGFDACTAPNRATMDELRSQSPYWGVGVYIGGPERTCAQPNLTRHWVHTQVARGWHVFPVWVGRQSPCADQTFESRIAAHNKKAAQQGVRAADQAVAAAQKLGIGKGSTLFVDIEGYDNQTSACNQPVLNYQSGWNKRLHSLGWKGAVYASASSGIASLDYIKTNFPRAYTLPQAIWISHADGKPSTHSSFVHDAYWAHQRLKQYSIDTTRSFGTATLLLDESAIEIGKGSVAPPEHGDCGGVALDFPRYRTLKRGASGPQVKAAQCLLKQRGLYKPGLKETFDAATARGVGRFQIKHALRPTKTLNAATWTALLSAGGTPLSKRGSASARVRGIQRALTAALGKTVAITGVFTAGTTSAVRTYEKRIGLGSNGVVGASIWHALQAGALH